MTECQISPDIVVFRAKCGKNDYLFFTQKKLGMTPPLIGHWTIHAYPNLGRDLSLQCEPEHKPMINDQ